MEWTSQDESAIGEESPLLSYIEDKQDHLKRLEPRVFAAEEKLQSELRLDQLNSLSREINYLVHESTLIYSSVEDAINKVFACSLGLFR